VFKDYIWSSALRRWFFCGNRSVFAFPRACDGSVLLLSSPVLLAVGFGVEATRSALQRPLTRLGVFAVTIGVLLQFIGFLFAARKSQH
jgi:hypothetical protein